MPDRSAAGNQYREAEITVVDETKRQINFIASDESVDRYGDIIRVAGWELDNYKKNPVLLYGHQSRDLPIGKVTEVTIDKQAKQLRTTAEFPVAGKYDFADLVWYFLTTKFLRAVSVGFRPTKDPNELKDEKTNRWTGYEWVGQELLELSVVTVPANPAALALAKSFDPRLINRLFPPKPSEGALAFHAARRTELEIIRLRAGG